MSEEIEIKIKINNLDAARKTMAELNNAIKEVEANLNRLDARSQKTMQNISKAAAELNSTIKALMADAAAQNPALIAVQQINDALVQMHRHMAELNKIKIKNPITEEAQRAKEAIDELIGRFATLEQQLLSISLDHVFDGISEKLKSVQQQLEEAIRATLDNADAEKVLANISKQLIQSLQDISQAFNPAADLKKQFDEINAAFMQLKTGLESIDPASVVERIKSGLQEVIDKIGETVTTIRTILSSINPAELLAKQFDAIYSTLKEFAETISELPAQIIRRMIDTVSSTISTLIQDLGIEDFVNSIGVEWEKLTGWFQEGIDKINLFGEAIGKIKEIGTGIVEVIDQIINKPADVISKLFNLDFGGILQGISKIFPIIGNFQQAANEQIESIESQWNSISELVERNIDEQIRMIEEKYANIISALVLPSPTQLLGQTEEEFLAAYEKYKEYMLRIVAYEKELMEQKAKEIEIIQSGSLEKQEEIIKNHYDGDLEKYLENERKKIAAEIEFLEKEKEERIKAGLDYADIDAKLLEAHHRDNMMKLNQDLLAAGDNAKAKYEAKKAYLEAEMALNIDNAEKVKQINEELAENERAYREEKIAALEDFTSKSMEQMTGIDEVLKGIEEAKLKRLEENNEEEKAKLAEKLKNGEITQAEHDNKLKILEENLDKEKAKIAKRQAIREKGMKIYEVGMNTAAAVMKIWAEVPKFDFGISTGIMTALAIGMGAAQIAAIASTPLPQASRGLLLHGNSHAQGGIPIEAEGGEAIINKRSTSMFMPLLSAINQAGGGVPFAAPLSDGGFAVRASQSRQAGISVAQMEQAMARAVSQVKVYTTVEDIRKGERNYSRIENRASY